jgi:HEXXH motif-containing protein
MGRDHRLTGPQLAQLAAGQGDRSVILALRAGQLSKRKLQLRLLRDLARSSRFDDHFALLAEVSRVAPKIGDRMLLLPHTGAWLAAALRRVRGSWPSVHPVEVDMDHLGALAAAAAVYAGIDVKVELVPRDGAVFLPDLGLAAVGGAPAVNVSQAGGELRVGPVAVPGHDGWQGLRRLHSDHDGLAVTVCLDDVDPFRDCHRLSAAGRLPEAGVATWQRLLGQAWPILVTHHREYAEAIAEGLVAIVPLLSQHANRGMNVTSMDAFGAVSLTTPADGLGLALGLLHEFQHAKLGALLDLVPLYQRDDLPRFYAPWRDDPRPLGAALQGGYAFLAVTDFHRVQRGLLPGAPGRMAEAEFVRWRDRVWRTFQELESSGQFTQTGERFLAGLRARQEGWRDESVSPESVELAEKAAADHWAGWRLRNRRPDPEAVAQLAEAWRAGLRCPSRPVPTTVEPQPNRQLAHSARLDLARLRITDSRRFAALCAEPASLAALLPDASPADLALARGDHAAAQAAYRLQILSGAGGPDAWTGLALACQWAGGPPLLDFPELCLAVHRQVSAAIGRPADPLALADWLLPVECADGAGQPGG